MREVQSQQKARKIKSLLQPFTASLLLLRFSSQMLHFLILRQKLATKFSKRFIQYFQRVLNLHWRSYVKLGVLV